MNANQVASILESLRSAWDGEVTEQFKALTPAIISEALGEAVLAIRGAM